MTHTEMDTELLAVIELGHILNRIFEKKKGSPFKINADRMVNLYD